MTTMTKRSGEVTARHAELIAEANEALDKLGPLYTRRPHSAVRGVAPLPVQSTTRLKLSASPRRSTRHSTSERRSCRERWTERATSCRCTPSHISPLPAIVSQVSMPGRCSRADHRVPGLRRDLLGTDEYYPGRRGDSQNASDAGVQL